MGELIVGMDGLGVERWYRREGGRFGDLGKRIGWDVRFRAYRIGMVMLQF